MVMVSGDPVIWRPIMADGTRDRHFAACAVKKSAVENKYLIKVCKSGEQIAANKSDITVVPMPDLADGIEEFNYR
jgi:hypothetical protein